MQPTDKLSTKHAAEYLGANHATVRTWRSKNLGPDYIKVQGRVYYERAALDRYKSEYNIKRLSVEPRQQINMKVTIDTRSYIDVMAAERGISLGEAVDRIVSEHVNRNETVCKILSIADRLNGVNKGRVTATEVLLRELAMFEGVTNVVE